MKCVLLAVIALFMVAGCGTTTVERTVTVKAAHVAPVEGAPDARPSPPQAVTRAPAAPVAAQEPSGPDRALCVHLYAEWQAGDSGAQAAIEEYAQIGCDQAPPASAARCPTNYSPWGYSESGDVICAPQAGTPADAGNGDNTITVPAGR